MSHGVDTARAASTVDQILTDSTAMSTHLATLLNSISLTRAMQAGYALACRDHGLPVPDMKDPAAEYGLK